MRRYRLEVTGPWPEWRPARSAPVGSGMTDEEASTFDTYADLRDAIDVVSDASGPFRFRLVRLHRGSDRVLALSDDRRREHSELDGFVGDEQILLSKWVEFFTLAYTHGPREPAQAAVEADAMLKEFDARATVSLQRREALIDRRYAIDQEAKGKP